VQTRIIEATRNNLLWGKFLVGRPDVEWLHVSAVSERPLLREIGWEHRHLLVVDLQTGKGAIFLAVPSGKPEHDLRKAGIHVCPLFWSFLEWLYAQDLNDLTSLPDVVKL
jgi:hypothetical protein